jgi:hypothetical protein
MAEARKSASAVFASELVNTTGGVDDLLLACIKWMASGANFNLQILTKCRLGLEGVAATAMDGDGLVFGMNIRLHNQALSKKSEQRDDKFFMVLKTALHRKMGAFFGEDLPAVRLPIRINILFRFLPRPSSGCMPI